MRLFNFLNLRTKIYILFPFLESIKANAVVRGKIKKIECIEDGQYGDNIDYMKGYQKLEYSEVEEYFNKTLNVKKSLEDKLKTSLISVTVGGTVIASLVPFLFSDNVFALHIALRISIFATVSCAIFFMMVAGIFSMKTISGYIRVFQLYPDDIVNATDEEKIENLAILTELNSLSNIIRQNLMNMSFRCIINSLFIITIFFFLIGVGSFMDIKKSTETIKRDQNIQQNNDNIETLKSNIFEMKHSDNKMVIQLQTEMTSINKNISQTNGNIKEIEKQVEVNVQEIQKIRNKKSKKRKCKK